MNVTALDLFERRHEAKLIPAGTSCPFFKRSQVKPGPAIMLYKVYDAIVAVVLLTAIFLIVSMIPALS